jgi:hypothetical protein
LIENPGLTLCWGTLSSNIQHFTTYSPLGDLTMNVLFLHSQIKTKIYFEKKQFFSNIRFKNFYQNKNDIFAEQK